MSVTGFFEVSLAVAALASFPIRGAQPQSLDVTLTPYLAEFGLPALAAAVVQNGSIVAARAVGTRRAGAEIPVSIQDRFHLGSGGKAFTSVLAGQFVEAGKLGWNATPADTFPELKSEMNGEFAKITLEQLLSHASGLTDKALLDLVYRSYRYALGWAEVKESWAPVPPITHTGSNTMNLATAMFWPKADFGFVMLTNIGGQRADAALRKLAAELSKSTPLPKTNPRYCSDLQER